jgi:predicted extracellular nuclease
METGTGESSATDREGFEPSKRFEQFTRFPGVRLQPLGHLSRLVARAQLSRALETRQRAAATLLMAFVVTLGAAARHPSRLTPISAIQGRSHASPLAGQRVTTRGVVTAVVADGFCLQDTAGDGDPTTSDGIFVERPLDGSLEVGAEVRLAATVVESPTGGSAAGLPVTWLVQPSAVEIASRANRLPPPVVLGAGGQPIPRTDPVAVMDFLETLEGMRVTLRRPTALSATESRGGGRSDFFAHPDPGADGTHRHARTAAGGILLRSGPDNTGDQNPDRLRIAFGALHRGRAPAVSVGDVLADVTGILDYAYGAFQVLPVDRVVIATRSGWRPETTELRRAASHLTIATYNVLNLSADSSDDRQRARLASQIVGALHQPDILALQEIQDSSGERDDGVVDGRPTLRKLAAAVVQAGGPRYAYFEVAPVDGRPGGAPGANIRNAFLYDSTRVKLVRHRALTASVLAARGAPDPDAFAESRDPLEALFEAGGRRITVINNHLTSRYGSSPVFGAVQPYIQAGEAQREAQARALHAYVSGLLEDEPSSAVVVLGDMNTFELSDDLSAILPGSPPLLHNLIDRVAEHERYTYNFEGNSQVLDHIFVSRALAASAEVDVVHLNADFPSAAGASDHDPVVARFRR